MNPPNRQKPTLNLTVIGLMNNTENRFDSNLQSIIKNTPLILTSKRNLSKLTNQFDFSDKQIHYFDPDYFKALEAFSKIKSDKIIFASGDPGYFGALRSVKHYFFDHNIACYPVDSSVSLAFSLLAEPWDDATVISTLGRPLFPVMNAVAQSPKSAVLCTKNLPPNELAEQLAQQCDFKLLSNRRYFVMSNLDKDPVVTKYTFKALTASKITTDSILLILPKSLPSNKNVMDSQLLPKPQIANNLPSKQIVFGQSIDAYKTVRSMITKPEVRAIVLSKLNLENGKNLLEIGAGSGSISIEAIKLAPLMRVISFERDPVAYANLRQNMKNHNVVFETYLGDFYEHKEKLPKADAVLIGGGKLERLNRLFKHANPGATVVGVFASLDRAQKLAKILGNLIQVNINAGKFFADNTLHLTAHNPVFIVWGQNNPT